MVIIDSPLTALICRYSSSIYSRVIHNVLWTIQYKLLVLLRSLRFVVRNSVSVVCDNGMCIHIGELRIVGALDVPHVTGAFLSTPFWNCRGEWGAWSWCRYIRSSLRRTHEYHSYLATTLRWHGATDRMTDSGSDMRRRATSHGWLPAIDCLHV